MTEWYRTPDWDGDAQAHFERRLSRARDQQPEYLRIKAMALQDAGLLHEAAGLYERFLAEHPDALGTSYVQELLGDVAREQGRLEEAERRYLDLLARRPLLDSSGMVEVSLAEVLLEQGKPDEAAAALAEVDVDCVATFNAKLFRYLAAWASVAYARSDVERAASAAADALELVDAPPQFDRHPTVGLVETDDATVGMLRALALAGRDGPGPSTRPQVGRLGTHLATEGPDNDR
jgi:predicted Zn-dependent protease